MRVAQRKDKEKGDPQEELPRLTSNVVEEEPMTPEMPHRETDEVFRIPTKGRRRS